MKMTPLLAALLVVGGGLMLLLAAVTGDDRARSVAHRLQLIGRTPLRRHEPVTAPATRLTWRQAATNWSRAIFTFGMPRSWGVSTQSGPLLLIGLTVAVSTVLFSQFVFHLAGHAIEICGIVGFFVIPRIICLREQVEADNQFGDLLPDAIDMVVRIIRAGLPVVAAIRSVGREAPAPVGKVFADLADQVEIGVPLDQALAKSSAAIGNADFRFFAIAVSLQQSTGGNLAETLQTLTQIIRQRRAVRLKGRAATAEVRMSALVLGALPFFVAATLYVLAPHYFDQLLDDTRGQYLLLAALLLLLFAGLVMRSMIRSTLPRAG